MRRESSDTEDLFIAHIGAMDTMALALKKAAQIIGEKHMQGMLEARYASFKETELGKKVEAGKASLADCEKYVLEHGEPKQTSAKQEKFERVLNSYFN